MPRGFLRDGSGIPRQAVRPFLRDLSGIPRMGKRIFIRDASGVPRLWYAGGYSGTVTSGALPPAYNGGIGYLTGGYGSVNPAVDLQGHGIYGLYNDYSTDFTIAYLNLQISGFSFDPTIDYFRTLTINGNSVAASLAGYSYSGGVASWAWTNVVPSLPPDGTTWNWSYQ